MFPVFRQRDGYQGRDRNDEVFEFCQQKLQDRVHEMCFRLSGVPDFEGDGKIASDDLLGWHRKDLLFERGIDVCHETVRLWWNRFGPLFAADIRRRRVSRMKGFRQWKWHLDEVYVKINGEMHYLWRAVDQ